LRPVFRQGSGRSHRVIGSFCGCPAWSASPVPGTCYGVRKPHDSGSDGLLVWVPRQLLLRCSTSCIPAVEGDQPGDGRSCASLRPRHTVRPVHNIQRFEYHMCGAIIVRCFELVAHFAVPGQCQALGGYGWSCNVTPPSSRHGRSHTGPSENHAKAP
jgi:hypothetical protein